MKVYVASKWENKDRVRGVMFTLETLGHTITYDWTQHDAAPVQQAILDMRGVTDADVVVGIFEEELSYAGALMEVGGAIALGKPVYILGHASVTGRAIFFQHPHVHFINNIQEIS
jgi:nucleoside 2-deoxyribosyltransferase